jgi:hypothetical protein
MRRSAPQPATRKTPRGGTREVSWDLGWGDGEGIGRKGVGGVAY